MKIDASVFLKALNITVPYSAKTVNNRCVCPFHGDTEGVMQYAVNNVTGNVFFFCKKPSCGFRGDAMQFVAKLKNISLAESARLFAPGRQLSSCLKEPFGEAELSEYLDGRKTQIAVAEYMRECSTALKLHPEKCGIRAGLSQTTLRLLPETMGLLVINDSMPKEFYEFRKAKYRQSTLVCCPYTFNNEITHVDIYDAQAPTFKYTVPIARADTGIYLESNVPSDNLLVTEDSMAASIFYSTLKGETLQTPPIVSAAGFPFPENYADVKTLNFVSCRDYPLSLEYALKLLTVPEYFSGSSNRPEVVIWNLSLPARDMKISTLRGLLSAASRKPEFKSWPTEYVAMLLNQMAEQQKLSMAASIIRNADLPKIVKSVLAESIKAKGYSPEILDILTDVDGNLSDITLANGRSLKSKPTELCAMTRDGFVTLCNVGLTVNNKIRAYDGKELLICTVTPQDQSISPVKVSLPENSWSSAASIKKIVRKAFTSAGHVPYLAFYDVSGYNWDDILSRLAEKCPLSKEIAELGLDDVSDLNMPNFTIRKKSNTIDVQDRVFTLPDCVLRAYSGIPGQNSMGAIDAMRRLLDHCDNLYVAAFTCGLMHVLYQMSYAMGARYKTKLQAPRHLFYVETEAGIWGGVFKQLSDLFSGNDFTPTVSYADPSSTLDEYRQLGTLPLIAYVPSMGNKLSQAIDSHTTSIIGLVDSTTAVMTNGRVSAMYITPSNENPANMRIAQEHIEAIRDTFASFLCIYLKEACLDSNYRTTSMPCVAAYKEVCRICGREPQALIDNISQTYFPGFGMTGVNTFFDMLHRGIMDDRRKTHICVLNEAPQKGYSFTGRGQHVFVMKDLVIIGHNVVDLVNKASENVFAIDQLSQELQERQLLEDVPEDLNLDPKRCWCIPRDVWQKDIVRPPVQLSEPMTNNTIKLAPM